MFISPWKEIYMLNSDGPLCTPSNLELKEMFARQPCYHFTFDKKLSYTFSQRSISLRRFRILNKHLRLTLTLTYQHLSTYGNYVYHMILTINSDYFPEELFVRGIIVFSFMWPSRFDRLLYIPLVLTFRNLSLPALCVPCDTQNKRRLFH
jgi:hypothetical protein